MGEQSMAAGAEQHSTGIDAYKPSEMARRVETAGVTKANLALQQFVIQLAIVTLGNIVGGAGGVAFAYRACYLRGGAGV